VNIHKNQAKENNTNEIQYSLYINLTVSGTMWLPLFTKQKYT